MLVVDKDVEGLSEWTLGEVKTEWVRRVLDKDMEGLVLRDSWYYEKLSRIVTKLLHRIPGMYGNFCSKIRV